MWMCVLLLQLHNLLDSLLNFLDSRLSSRFVLAVQFYARVVFLQAHEELRLKITLKNYRAEQLSIPGCIPIICLKKTYFISRNDILPYHLRYIYLSQYKNLSDYSLLFVLLYLKKLFTIINGNFNFQFEQGGYF